MPGAPPMAIAGAPGKPAGGIMPGIDGCAMPPKPGASGPSGGWGLGGMPTEAAIGGAIGAGIGCGMMSWPGTIVAPLSGPGSVLAATPGAGITEGTGAYANMTGEGTVTGHLVYPDPLPWLWNDETRGYNELVGTITIP